MRADALAKREAIVLAAKDLIFKENAELSFRLIATEADVGVATVHRHFPSLVDLLVEVIPLALADIQALIDSFDPMWESDPAKAWHTICHTLSGMEATVLNDSFYLTVVESLKVEKVRELLISNLRPLIAGLLNKAVKHGFVAPDLEPLKFHFGLVAASRPLPIQVERIEPGFSAWAVDNFLSGLRSNADTSK
ncbi:TetR family transcriptional regulator [Corynebacterium suranareeae]|uniref:TetR family transcriptional regulator n=2 Tax=Corynebacterium suranareeae TaxID=2506452 RepID=A0A160PTE7_9CORY|nr:TetR family transcriptional regulator [Corynebacterium suranareeae]